MCVRNPIKFAKTQSGFMVFKTATKKCKINWRKGSKTLSKLNILSVWEIYSVF